MGAPVSQQGSWSVGATSTVTVAIARLANATQYTAGDVVSSSAAVPNVLTFTNIARTPGGGGIIQSAIFIDDTAAATKPDLELYLFDSPIQAQGDNLAWAPTDLEMLSCVGVIAFATGAFKIAGTNGIIAVTGLGQAFNCAANSQNLYGVLVARNAYTPASGEVLELRLNVLQD